MAPVTAEENSVSGFAARPCATATPMAAPTTGEEADTTSANGASQPRKGTLDNCERISPMMSEENRPSAMELMAWMK